MENTSTVQVPADPTLDPEVIRQYVTKNYNLSQNDKVRIGRNTLRSFTVEIFWATR